MKALNGPGPLFSRASDEDLEDTIGVIEKMSRMCTVTEAHFLTTQPLRLSINSLSYF